MSDDQYEFGLSEDEQQLVNESPVINLEELENQPPPPPLDALMGERFIQTLYAPARHKAIYGGRGSAKSWSVATYLALRAANERKKLIVCARQFQNSIRDSSKELIEKRIYHLGLETQFDITEREITHSQTGSRFAFIGLDRNIDSIRSLEGADVVWIDEARTIKDKSMEILLPTVRSAESELIWTWNPELPDDPVDAYFRKGAPPDRSIVTFVDYTDNPFFYHTELPYEMEVLKRGNLQRYRHVWLGEYDDKHSSRVFTNTRIGTMDINPDTMPMRLGMDFGFGSDPSFVVRLYVDEIRKRLYIAQEASGRVPMDDLPVMVRSVVGYTDDTPIIADSSNPGAIEFLQRRGFNMVPAQKGPGSIKAGINFLQGYDIIIDPSCEQMREEARLYSWMMDQRTRTVLPVPLDQNNHGWDACRYAVESLAVLGNNQVYDPHGGVMKLKMRR